MPLYCFHATDQYRGQVNSFAEPCSCTKALLPPCEHRDVLYASVACWVRDGLIACFEPQGPGGISQINKRLWNRRNISQVISSALSQICLLLWIIAEMCLSLLDMKLTVNKRSISKSLFCIVKIVCMSNLYDFILLYSTLFIIVLDPFDFHIWKKTFLNVPQ